MTIQNKNRPRRLLIGIGGVLATAGLLSTCEDKPAPDTRTVSVQRTRYATREACLQQWDDWNDCTYVPELSPTATAGIDLGTAASGAAAASQASAASVASAGGGGSGGGGGSSGGESGAGVHHAAGWYGPYYTREGFVYNQAGSRTTRISPAINPGDTSSMVMRETSLTPGSSAYMNIPSRVATTESRAISRGEFLSFPRSSRARAGWLGGSRLRMFSGWHSSGG